MNREETIRIARLADDDVEHTLLSDLDSWIELCRVRQKHRRANAIRTIKAQPYFRRMAGEIK
jgi:hypothetical protein